MGEDSTPLNDVSLSRWADQVAALVTGTGERVILVGHSRGGAIISEVAERVPESIRLLVYLAAFLLPCGKSVFDLAATGSNAEAINAAFTSLGDGTLSINEAVALQLFYDKTPEMHLGIARRSLGREPLPALTTPVHVTPARFGSVRRAYIECTSDQAIPIALQRAMLVETPCEAVVSLDCDHSPFLSAPVALCDAITLLASSTGSPKS
jgi:pimeloyl-ACP methyl ester carboxylesterase